MSREAFLPQREPACARGYEAMPADDDPWLHSPAAGWSGPRNANHTLVPTRWSRQSPVLMDSGVLAPAAREMYRPINPITRIGVTARVRAWDGPFSATGNAARDGLGYLSASPCSSATSVYELQPGEPGRLVARPNDSTDGTMFQQRYYYQPGYWDRYSGPLGGPYRPAASCPSGQIGGCPNEPVGVCPGGIASRCPTQYGGLDVDTDHIYAQNLGPALGENGQLLSDTWWQGSPVAGWNLACGQPQTDPNLSPGVFATRAHHRGEDFVSGRSRGAAAAPSGSRVQRGATQFAGANGGQCPGCHSQLQLSAGGYPVCPRCGPVREGLRSQRRPDEPMTGMMDGLGSSWVDPRFEPGPQQMYTRNDSHWAMGSHAGGPTFGALTPAVFLPPTAGWNGYVHGFDGTIDSRSQWVDAS